MKRIHFCLSLLRDKLVEAWKYGLSLFLAHQCIDQLHEDILSAIFGNVGTLICFRVCATDTEHLESEFESKFDKNDFIKLPRFGMYSKLKIDGITVCLLVVIV